MGQGSATHQCTGGSDGWRCADPSYGLLRLAEPPAQFVGQWVASSQALLAMTAVDFCQHKPTQNAILAHMGYCTLRGITDAVFCCVIFDNVMLVNG
jgi:hypothetical protein